MPIQKGWLYDITKLFFRVEKIFTYKYILFLFSYFYFFIFKKFCFIDYAITVVLISPLCPYFTQPAPPPPGNPPTTVHVCGSSYKCSGYPISYTVLYIPLAILQLPICPYLPHLFNHYPHTPLIWQPSKWSLHPWFYLCSSCLLS